MHRDFMRNGQKPSATVGLKRGSVSDVGGDDVSTEHHSF